VTAVNPASIKALRSFVTVSRFKSSNSVPCIFFNRLFGIVGPITMGVWRRAWFRRLPCLVRFNVVFFEQRSQSMRGEFGFSALIAVLHGASSSLLRSASRSEVGRKIRSPSSGTPRSPCESSLSSRHSLIIRVSDSRTNSSAHQTQGTLLEGQQVRCESLRFLRRHLRYLYLPRLKDRDVLAQAIVKGAGTRDFFGTAYGQSATPMRDSSSEIPTFSSMILFSRSIQKLRRPTRKHTHQLRLTRFPRDLHCQDRPYPSQHLWDQECRVQHKKAKHFTDQ
jgi:hypothetical protein